MKFGILGFVTAIAAAILVAACPSQALATIELGFWGITNNIPGDVAIAEAQMSVVVSSAGSNQVLFTFSNLGGPDAEASSITDIYFDDGSLLGIASIDDTSVGVSFSQDADPGDLPGGGKDFITTAGFSADSDPAVQPNGVNPGESVGILFDLIAGQTYDDVLTDLASRELQIGIRVQGFDSGGSESLVNAPVPEPSTLVIWSMLGGLGFAVARWRRRKAA